MKKHKPWYCPKCGAQRDPYSDTCLSYGCLADYWEWEAGRLARQARDHRAKAAELRRQAEAEKHPQPVID